MTNYELSTDDSNDGLDGEYNIELHTTIKECVESAVSTANRLDDESAAAYRDRAAILARTFLVDELSSMEIFRYGTDLLDAAIENVMLTVTDPWELVTDVSGRKEWRHDDMVITLVRVHTGWTLEFEEFDHEIGSVVCRDIKHGGHDDRATLQFKAETWMVNNRD